MPREWLPTIGHSTPEGLGLPAGGSVLEDEPPLLGAGIAAAEPSLHLRVPRDLIHTDSAHAPPGMPGTPRSYSLLLLLPPPSYPHTIY